jgi:hypothetical protein
MKRIALVIILKTPPGGAFRSVQESLITSFQHGLLKSRLTWTFPDASVRNWMLAIHAGMTKFVGERKLMTHRGKVIL